MNLKDRKLRPHVFPLKLFHTVQ